MPDHSQQPPIDWHGAKFELGLDASKGSPEVQGELYFATDTYLVYLSLDGVAWTTYSAALCNLTATVDPTVNDDVGDGYIPGSLWVNKTSGAIFMCSDNTSTAAVWDQVNAAAGFPTAVWAKAHMSTNQVLTASSGDVTVQFDTEDVDTDAAYNPSTYQFTAPADGVYLVTYGMYISGSPTTSGTIYAKIKFNGSTTGQFWNGYNPSAAFSHSWTYSEPFTMTAGQTIEIVVANLNTATGITINTGFLTVTKVGV